MIRITTEIRKRYQNNVLGARLKAGFAKQKDFAAKIGMSPSILCEIESNKQFLSTAYALRIAEVLKCSLDELFEKRTGKKSED